MSPCGVTKPQCANAYVFKLCRPGWIILCFLTPDETCDVSPLGTKMNAGTEWSDESCALIHGPVTGVRMWRTTGNNNRIKL